MLSTSCLMALTLSMVSLAVLLAEAAFLLASSIMSLMSSELETERRRERWRARAGGAAALRGCCCSSTSPDVLQLVLSLQQVLLQGPGLAVGVRQALVQVPDVTGGF